MTLSKERVEELLSDPCRLTDEEMAFAETCLAIYEREERLRKALEPFANLLTKRDWARIAEWSGPSDKARWSVEVLVDDIRNARAAIKETAAPSD